MTPEELYQAWAQPGCCWSPWVKPVLFAHLQPVEIATTQASDPVEMSMLAANIRLTREMAVVIDLPGADGVHLGLQLATGGHWPVPLYNSLPGSTHGYGGIAAPTAVEMRPIMKALIVGAEKLATIRPTIESPPAFLLDRRRRVGDNAAGLSPGGFDNRSVSLPSDFPSASMLLSSGIRQVVVFLTAGDVAPQADLAHTLRRWQDAGITIAMLRVGVDAEPRPIDVAPPRWYRSVWHSFLVKLGLRPHLLGGFGGFIPIPSAG